MAEQQSNSKRSLKAGVRWRTRAYALIATAGIVWTALGMPITVPHLHAIQLSAWLLSIFTTVFSLIIVAVDSVPGPNGKAMLVFWRRHDPLPGSRAFDKTNFERDTRLDQGRVREVVGGTFPRKPSKQNSAWYRLYKMVEGDHTVESIHFEYLLHRDLAWLSVVFLALSLGNLLYWPPSAPLLALAALGFALLYVLFRRAAVERGERFVNQVLLAASSPVASTRPNAAETLVQKDQAAAGN